MGIFTLEHLMDLWLFLINPLTYLLLMVTNIIIPVQICGRYLKRRRIVMNKTLGVCLSLQKIYMEIKLIQQKAR